MESAHCTGKLGQAAQRHSCRLQVQEGEVGDLEDDLKDQLEDDTSEHSEDDSDNTEDDSEDDWGDDLTNALNASNGPESAAGQARKEWKMETPSWPRL